MDIGDALKTRRSVRRYQQKPVPREILCEVVDMCRFAPSAANRQEWEIVLVDDPQNIRKVYETLAWLPAVGPPPADSRPTAYAVIISDEKSDGVSDCASVTTYMLLAAHSRGLGSCWFGSISRTELANLLGIPDKYSVEFVVALGYPDEKVKAVNNDGDREVTVKEEYTQVPKRTSKDILHLNFFGKRG